MPVHLFPQDVPRRDRGKQKFTMTTWMLTEDAKRLFAERKITSRSQTSPSVILRGERELAMLRAPEFELRQSSRRRVDGKTLLFHRLLLREEWSSTFIGK